MIAVRADAEEIEYLTLSWFTDHAQRARAWDWALAAARTLRPVKYAMNTQLSRPCLTYIGPLRPVSHYCLSPNLNPSADPCDRWRGSGIRGPVPALALPS